MEYSACARRFFAAIMVALAGLAYADVATAQTTRTWSGPPNGDWFAATNWTPSGVPGPIDTLNFNGGTINLTAPATVGGQFNWTSGTLVGDSLTIASSGVLTISGNGTVYLENALVTAGTVNWVGTAGIAVYNNGAAFSGAIQNLAGGVWNIQSDQTMSTGYSGPYAFNNAGTVIKSVTTGTTTIDVPFNNSGSATNQSGTINFNSGGTIGGKFAAASGTMINFNGGNFTNASAAAFGPGTVQISGGSLSLPADIVPNLFLAGGNVNLGPAFQGGAITNLTLSGSTLNGTNTVTGIMAWTAGAISGALTVAASGVLDITSNSTVYLEGPLTNAGTVNWTGTAGIAVYNNNSGFLGSIQNLAGGLWNIQSDQSMTTGYGGPYYFGNAGTVVKSVTTGTTTIDLPFNNSGVVTNLSGTINFNGGGTLGGGFSTSAGKAINFNGGSFTGAGAVVGGLGTVQFSGGNLSLPADLAPNLLLTGGNVNLGPAFQGGGITNLTLSGATLNGTNTVTGVMTWTAGAISGPLTVGTGGVLNLTGNSTVYVESPLINAGMVNWLGTVGIAVYNNNSGFMGSIANLAGGVWNIQSDQSMSIGYSGPYFFNNAGSVVKSVTTGTTTISVPFNNTGTVTNLSGTINFNGGGTIGGTFAASTGKSINFDGGNFTSAGAVINGPGTVQVNGANLTLTANSVPNLLLSGGNVTLGPTFQGGTITNLTLSGTALNGTNTVSGIFNCGGGFSGSLLVAAGGTMNWTGGDSAGPLNVASNAVLNIAGNSTVYVEAPLTNAGTVNWLGTVGIAVYNNGSGFTGLIENLTGAVWNIQSDQSMSPGYSGPYYFNNAGTLTKSVATGTTTISVPFYNPGAVTNLSGNINFNDGGTIGGTLEATAGGTINFNGGNFNATAATVSGAGMVQLNGGSLTLLNNTISNFVLNSGTLNLGPAFQGGAITNLALVGTILNGTNQVSGTFSCGGGFNGSLTVLGGGLMNWTGGASLGPLTVASGAILNIGGNSTVYVEAPLTNAGIVNWTGTVGIAVYNNSSGYTGLIQNLAGAVWNIQSDQSMSVGYSGNYYFNNAGSVIKSIATGTTTFSIPFYNLGSVASQSGAINFNDGGTIGGAYSAAAGKIIGFTAGNSTSSGATITGPGTIQMTSGNLTLANNIIPNLLLAGGTLNLAAGFQGGAITNLTLAGAALNGTNSVTGIFNCGGGFSGSLLVAGGAIMNWTGGAAAGPLTVATNGVLNIAGSSTVYLEAPLTNAGSVDWTGTAGIAVYNNNSGYLGSIQNLAGGVWNIQSDQSMSTGYNGPYFFNNAGTVIKSETTGTTTISPPFSNSGTLDIENGTMNFNGNPAYTQTGATIDFGVGSPAAPGHVSVSGNLALDGTLGITLLNGYAPKTGDVIPLITYGSESGIFNNLDLPQLGTGQVWRSVYNAGSFQLQVVTNSNFASQITGSVSDTLGHAVTNINVFAFTTNSGSDLFISTLSDVNGNYALVVTNGNWTVGVLGLPARSYNPVANQSAGITNANAVVNFVVQPYAGTTYTITTGVNPAGAGTVAGGGTFAPGASVTVTAAAITNTLPYIFTNWTENGVFESASSSYSFSAARNRQLVANFTLPIFTVSASNNPVGAGNITGAGSYFYAATSLLTASPIFGYTFTNWTENSLVVGTNLTLSTVIYTNHSFVANYTAANLVHTITTVTAPPGLAAVAGAGTYTNGQTANFSAPQFITNSPVIYTFQKFTLSNTVVGTSATFNKTFSTLDPTNLQYVAVYTAKTILPLVTNVSANFPNPVPATTNFLVTLRFDRAMNAGILPLVVLTNSAASIQPVVRTNGQWSATFLANDTYTTPPIILSLGMDGTNQLFVSAAQDTNGNVLPITNAASFVVDATPPAPPVLTLTASNSTSATVGWTAYSAPSDLNGFRVYLSTTNFNSVAGMSSLTGLGSSARSFQFGGLTLDKPYYVAVQAVDVAGNASTVIPLTVTLPSSVPPPVTVHESPVGANSALLSWSGYNASGLLGFAGFQIYFAQTNFTSVAGLTPQTMVGPTVTSSQVDGLNRANTYYFAVVGVNATNGFNPNVTTASWSDPYAGNITASTTIGGAGQNVVPINHSMSVVNNATLTILPGTTLLFAPGTSLTVPGGTLVANGTTLAPIIFDSANDTPGNTPAPGDWGGVTLGGGAGNSSLQFVEILYGAGLTLDNCAPKVQAFTALNNLPNGLTLQNAATLTTSNALVNGNAIGLEQFDTASLTVQNSEIENNGTNAIAAGTLPLNATGDWWGAPEETNITASIQGNVVYNPFLTYEPLLTPAIGASNGVTQVGVQSVNLELACRTAQGMRISEEITFAGVFFSPFTNYTTFPLSAGGGLKHIFAQYRSATGETNAPVEVVVTYITAGPVISSFSLAEGQVINRPLTVTGAATAALGMRDLEFYVDGVLQSTNAGGTFSQYFDIRTLANAVHQVELLARDTAGNIATIENDVVIAVTPPLAPVITQPGIDFGTNNSHLTISGTAEPGISIQVTDNGQILGVTNADATGHFTIGNVTLTEGANSLVAVASDSTGVTPSAARHVNVSTIPPAALVMNTPAYFPATGLTVSWRFAATGKQATAFQLFWSTSPFTTTNQATGHSILLNTMSDNVQALANGTYYFGVVGFDAVGNPSPLSPLVSAIYDSTPPALAIAYNPAPPVGVGQLGIVLTSSKNLAATPSLTIQPFGASSPISLSLTNVALNTWQSGLKLSMGLPAGTATVLAAAQDQVGNVFNGAPSGVPLMIDTTPPTGQITTVPIGPIQTTNNVNVVVNLALSEQAGLGTMPAVTFVPPVGTNISINMGGIGSNWSGTLPLTSAMGSGYGHFTLTAQDSVGNVGSNILSGAQLELYNTSLPSPPAAPTNLLATSLPGGKVRLTWNVSSNAQIYRLYRETGTNLVVPTTLDLDNITSNSVTDLPPADGYYHYGVSASRLGSESGISNVVVGLSDRTPPPAPTNVAVTLPNSGVEITWQEPSGATPDHFNVYRNNTLIQTVYAVVPVVDYPPRGTNSYVVSSVDVIGNENPSAPVAMQLLVGPIDNLSVVLGQAIVLNWSDNDSTAVGFNVYRNGIRQNAQMLTKTTFTDSLALVNVTQYAVTAVNNLNQESPQRVVSVEPASAAGTRTSGTVKDNEDPAAIAT